MGKKELKFVIFESDKGWIGILGSDKELVHITLPQPSAGEAERCLDKNEAIRDAWLFDDLIQRLQSYFSGHKVTFSDRLDISGATPFHRRVWEVTGLIPYGETRSYAWVAEQMGKPGAVRAVGQALGRNPLPIIIPCHRVVNSNGKLGGYTGGLGWKRYLLALESATHSK
jgi:methylated-DNA-[protein]-cysteine S-methyltransferase